MHHLPHIPTVCVSLHRLWSKFESGGGAHNASEASKRSHCAREGGGYGRGASYYAWVKLPALVLGVLLAVCYYFGNLGNALLCESCYFSTTN